MPSTCFCESAESRDLRDLGPSRLSAPQTERAAVGMGRTTLIRAP